MLLSRVLGPALLPDLVTLAKVLPKMAFKDFECRRLLTIPVLHPGEVE